MIAFNEQALVGLYKEKILHYTPENSGVFVVDDEILTISEVAKLLKINEKTVYKLVSQSDLPGFKVGGSWRFRAEELRRWMDTQASGSKKVRP